MGKIERTVKLDERLLEQVEAAGLTLEQAIKVGVEAAAKDRPIGIVANHERQKLDPAAAEERARRWAEENAEAIQDHKARIERRGVFGEDLRRW